MLSDPKRMRRRLCQGAVFLRSAEEMKARFAEGARGGAEHTGGCRKSNLEIQIRELHYPVFHHP